ncbi:MAG: pyridoxamine 5'-phosphate oxidase family protein [Candidatus Aenigmarchaeota archaeon]|nr:pyridoxamine 5'-phosphate oxidase family protein [Candidatus Aenigmarchaeota archaeon]
MDNALTKEELEKLYDEPNIAIIGTVKTGSPHMVPVWFTYDGKHFYVATSETQKVRNLRKDPHVTLLIASKDHRKVAVIEGSAEVYDDHGGQRIKFLASRYMPDRVTREKFVEFIMTMKRLIIKITPKKTISWDMGKRVL